MNCFLFLFFTIAAAATATAFFLGATVGTANALFAALFGTVYVKHRRTQNRNQYYAKNNICHKIAPFANFILPF